MDTANPVFQRIEQDLSSNDVVLYMKGTAAFPQCGFSATVAQILNHLGVTFRAVNVLEDPSIWQGIKDFSGWPTIPQLFIKKELIGGADITRELYESGELFGLLDSKGVQYTAPVA